MNCPHCGYLLTPLDANCPRCEWLKANPQHQRSTAPPPIPQPPPVYYDPGAMPPPPSAAAPVVIHHNVSSGSSWKTARGVMMGLFGCSCVLPFLAFVMTMSGCMSLFSGVRTEEGATKKKIPKPSASTQSSPAAPSSAPPSVSTYTPPPPPVDASAHRREFLNTMSEVPGATEWVTAVGRGITEDDLKIRVGQRWHYEPFQVRLQMAQLLWKLWAGIHLPNDPDKATITLEDALGNRVGGSGIMGGSVVHVDRD